MGLGNLLKGVFGTPNDRKIKTMRSQVAKINALEASIEVLDDAELRAKTDEFKTRLNDGETLDALLPEAFAVVREAAKRVLGLRPFDVQLMGGIVLHEGKIAEMRTGEGKTLTATMPVYLNALTGRGVHVVTVNDYLAARDAEWMGKIYQFLGLTSGALVSGLDEAAKREVYASDIAYATNNELGFDYLRDNMKGDKSQLHQRDHYFAIVDEVDSILIDEARTPLIISGPTPDRSELYVQINEVIPRLPEGQYEVDEKSKSATLTEEGIESVEVILKEIGLIKPEASLFEPENAGIVHHVNQALVAHKIYRRDRDYLMRGDQVALVDEFTGRVMDGRRLSNGLHQAIEAKEGVKILPENQTLASVTYQNYFRLYDKLAGMTGTALTEADEFLDIYKLDVVDVPTNRDVQRIDEHDRIYRTEKEKVAAMIGEVQAAHEKGQPTLIGTTSIEKSESLSAALTAVGVPHNVLNARQHEKEAQIIANAGVPGAVTIATNMAGRGTDIQLGGNVDNDVNDAIESGSNQDPVEIRADIEARIAADKQKALDAGGLFVIGTERHESRRIDNQLRGRSGRQGDPGRTLFFLSLEDDLMRIFGHERLDGMLKKLGLKDGEAMEHPWLNKALERAQRKVEGRNFDIRKNLLKFDDVMNEQRKVIFSQRREAMESDDLSETITEMRHDVADILVDKAIPPKAYVEKWNADGLKDAVRRRLNLDLPIHEWFSEEGVDENVILDRVTEASDANLARKEEKYGAEMWRRVEKQVLLSTIDKNWREHLETLDHLRSVVGFRGYAQRDPLNEYKTESFTLFESMLDAIRTETVTQISAVELMSQEEQKQMAERAQAEQALRNEAEKRGISPEELIRQLQAQATEAQRSTAATQSKDSATASAAGAIAATDYNGAAPEPTQRSIDAPAEWAQVGRNEPCPCGSGEKYKHCHGKTV